MKKQLLFAAVLTVASLSATAQTVTITGSKVVAVGTEVTVHYEGAPVGTSAWIGVYTGGKLGPKSSKYWSYTDGESGDVKFTLASYDVYYCSLFKDGNYDEIARSGWVLATDDYTNEQAEQFELTTDKKTYIYGEPITVSWKNAPAVSKDWIGTYVAGDVPGFNNAHSTSYAYVNASAGETTLNMEGVGNFDGYDAPGNYYATYLLWDKYGEPFQRAYYTVLAEKPTITVGSEGCCTYVAPYDVDFSDVDGIKAYIVTEIRGDKAIIEEATKVAAGAPVVILGAEGTYSLGTCATPNMGENLLKASVGIEADGKLVLSRESGVAGFYKTTGTIPAGQAYLESATEIKGFILPDGTPTAINAIQTAKHEAVYNLAGQCLQTPQKGINIIGGKKILK